jgi:hypothetical protein
MTAADPAPELLTLIALLRRDAEAVSDASKMLATDKSRRNQEAGDVGASYDWLRPSQTTQWKAADVIADIAAKLAEVERERDAARFMAKRAFDQLTTAIESQRRAEAALVAAQDALKPFANAVFNDNGDVSYNFTAYGTEDLRHAYCVLRRALPIPAAKPEGE